MYKIFLRCANNSNLKYHYMMKKFSWIAWLALCGCHTAKNLSSNDLKAQRVAERESAARNSVFAPGIAAYQDSRFNYIRDGEKILSVHFLAPYG